MDPSPLNPPNQNLPIHPSGKYDAAITGMGCAGLSLAVHLIRSGWAADKRILLIDKEQKSENDRTWCFWETGDGPFEEIVHRKWENAWFHAHGYSKLKVLDPYAYKMIRGMDYYRYCMQIISSHPAFEIRMGEVTRISSDSDQASIHIGNEVITCDCLFNSILFQPIRVKEHEHMLLQHFKGWIIETDTDLFDPKEATLMDFRPSQQHGTTFVYVLPLSANRALVEYTLFTPSLLPSAAYDKGLSDYMQDILGCNNYKIEAEEFGVIPMTNHRFRQREGRILHIGTAGGQTKASSGYTFSFIQKQSAQIAESLQQYGHPFHTQPFWKGRFDWYDSVLLHILRHKKLDGWFVFRELFRNNPPYRILKFLDNETSLAEEFLLLNSLPQWPFMKAGLIELVNRFR